MFPSVIPVFPSLSSSTLVPDLIGDPVKEWIQAIYEDPGVFLSPPFARIKTLDSCFRRNDRKRNRESRVLFQADPHEWMGEEKDLDPR